MVEAARTLGERTMKEGGATLESRLAYLFRLTTARRPDAKELAELTAACKDHLATFTRDGAKAKQLISVGELKPDTKLNPSELAAWTMMANLMPWHERLCLERTGIVAALWSPPRHLPAPSPKGASASALRWLCDSIP